jgi:hypothetical protein
MFDWSELAQPLPPSFADAALGVLDAVDHLARGRMAAREDVEALMALAQQDLEVAPLLLPPSGKTLDLFCPPTCRVRGCSSYVQI